MRPNLDQIRHVTTADLLAKLGSAPADAPADRLRDEAIGQLSTAPLISARVVMALSRATEGLAAGASGALIAIFHPGYSADTGWSYLPLIFAVGLAFPSLAQMFGLYTIQSLMRPADRAARLVTVWTMIFATVAVAVFASKSGDDYSRIWLASWYLIGAAGLLLCRGIISWLLGRWNNNGQLSRHAVLVGGGEPAASLLAALDSSPKIDVSVVGIFDDRDDQRSPRQVHNLPKLGNVSELIDFVRRARIDVLLVTLPLTAEERLLQILKRLWVLPVDIRLSAYSQKLHYRPRAYSYIGNIPFLDVFDKPLSDWGKILKNIEDKVIAACAVVLLSPVMLLVALAIRLDSKGPVLFKQKRYGFNNELIEVYKFRSMYHEMSDADASKLVTKGDPRVTPVGRFLRKSSLDELPQFFNVLSGGLSLVGPRPHATRAKAADQLYNDVVDGYFARHRVKPGITGWAQVNGWRGETDTTEKLQRRVEHDLYYIENWSLAFDLYILLKTPISLLKTESAY